MDKNGAHKNKACLRRVEQVPVSAVGLGHFDALADSVVQSVPGQLKVSRLEGVRVWPVLFVDDDVDGSFDQRGGRGCQQGRLGGLLGRRRLPAFLGPSLSWPVPLSWWRLIGAKQFAKE